MKLEPSARGPRRGKLAVRLIVVLVAGVALIYGAVAYWSISSQRTHMTRMLQTAAERSSALIRNATRDGMLENDLDRVGRTLHTIAGSEGVHRVRILDRNGVVRLSSANDRGESLSLDSFQCQICHRESPVPDQLPGARRMRVFKRDGEPYLNVVEPVINEPACSTQACHEHEAGRRVLGIIDTEIPLASMEAHIRASEAQLGIGFLLTVIAIISLTLFLLWNMVLRPVRYLAEAAGRVAKGDFSATVPVQTRDEIGQMASSWNAMVVELGRAHHELAEWGRTLEQRVNDKTKELEAAHQRMLVVEKMASLGKLAAVMAHEINNPLAGIATYAKLLRRKVEKAGEGTDQESGKILELMETEAKRCGKIVRNLLLFSRQRGARFTEEGLTPILERCALLVNHQAELEEVAIRLEVADALPVVQCDASQIQQVVLALVMNAIDAMKGGGTLTLRADRHPTEEALVIEVSDTGVGIKAENLPHVFEPFFTTKEQGEGVGLGLSVVYGIVERHKGRVDVESQVGAGTTFRVTLPLHQPEEGEDTSDGR